MKLRLWLLCAVMTLFAVPSFAQYEAEMDVISPDTGDVWYGSSSYEEGQYLDNPCTSVTDYVWVNYSAYVESAQKEAGVDRYLLSDSTNMGGGLSASGWAQADVGYPAAFTIRNYYKVNTADDFHVVTVVTVDPAAKYTGVAVETACGNGMPDSKE